jgi:hypothetical protein
MLQELHVTIYIMLTIHTKLAQCIVLYIQQDFFFYKFGASGQ